MSDTITIKDVYDEIKKLEKKIITKEEIASLLDTVEILSNKETMRQINDSIEDVNKGNVKEVSSFNDLVSDL